MAERHVTLMEEKQVIVKRQQEEVSRLMQTQVGDLPRRVDKELVYGQSGLKQRSQRALGPAHVRHLWSKVRQVPIPCIFQSQALFYFCISLDLLES